MIASSSPTATNAPMFIIIDSTSNATATTGWPWRQAEPPRYEVIVLGPRAEPDELEYFQAETRAELRYRLSREAIARHVHRLRRRSVRPVPGVWRPSRRVARVCSLAERWRATP